MKKSVLVSIALLFTLWLFTEEVETSAQRALTIRPKTKDTNGNSFSDFTNQSL